MKYKNIMAIGGHIGDMELTAGGVLATCSLQGGKITTVALTAGERGCPPAMSVSEYRKQKLHEAETFATLLQGEAIVFDTPDGELIKTEEVVLKLARLIRRHKPELLITHWNKSIHKDHIACHYIVKEAQFFAGLQSYVLDNLPPHYPAGPWYTENWEDPTDFKSYIYADTSVGYSLWEKAIQTHKFTTESKDFSYFTYYAHLQYVRGCLARTEKAQTFAIDEVGKVLYE